MNLQTIYGIQTGSFPNRIFYVFKNPFGELEAQNISHMKIK